MKFTGVPFAQLLASQHRIRFAVGTTSLTVVFQFIHLIPLSVQHVNMNQTHTAVAMIGVRSVNAFAQFLHRPDISC